MKCYNIFCDCVLFDFLAFIIFAFVNLLILIEKNANLVYEVVANVRFGHELANRELWITKLPHTSVLVTP
jgi:hypothetical protein